VDPITHGLAGAAAGMMFARSGALRFAALAGCLAALAPDLDVVIDSAVDPLLQLEVHRQYTHSLFVAPLLGALAALLVSRLGRDAPGFLSLFLPASAGAFTAGLIDACTSYGTALMWPLSDERTAWNVVAVVDPVLTVGFIIGVVVSFRRESGAVASLATGGAICYLLIGAVQHSRAEWVTRQMAEQRGHSVDALAVKPTLGNQVVWRSVYRSGETFWVDAIHTGYLGSPVVYPGGGVPVLAEDSPTSLSARQSEDIQRFGRLSAGYLVAHPLDERVVGDVRYAMSPDSVTPLWGIELPADDSPTRWRNFREWNEQKTERFKAMLMGRTLEPLSATGDRSSASKRDLDSDIADHFGTIDREKHGRT
jgi:inner membrane protein